MPLQTMKYKQIIPLYSDLLTFLDTYIYQYNNKSSAIKQLWDYFAHEFFVHFGNEEIAYDTMDEFLAMFIHNANHLIDRFYKQNEIVQAISNMSLSEYTSKGSNIHSTAQTPATAGNPNTFNSGYTTNQSFATGEQNSFTAYMQALQQMPHNPIIFLIDNLRKHFIRVYIPKEIIYANYI